MSPRRLPGVVLPRAEREVAVGQQAPQHPPGRGIAVILPVLVLARPAERGADVRGEVAGDQPAAAVEARELPPEELEPLLLAVRLDKEIDGMAKVLEYRAERRQGGSRREVELPYRCLLVRVQ